MIDTNIQFVAVNTNKSTLQSTPVTDGRVYFVSDTKELFYDFGTVRNEIKDILILEKEAERTNILFAPLNKFYFVLETQILWVYKDGTWYQVSHDMNNYYDKSVMDSLLVLKQDKLIAGDGIFIENNVISAVGYEASYDEETETLTFSAAANYTSAYNLADKINGES